MADIAADYLRRSLAVAPEFALAHLHAGVAHETLGDPRRALAHYRRALDLEPEAPWTSDATVAMERIIAALAATPQSDSDDGGGRQPREPTTPLREPALAG